MADRSAPQAVVQPHRACPCSPSCGRGRSDPAASARRRAGRPSTTSSTAFDLIRRDADARLPALQNAPWPIGRSAATTVASSRRRDQVQREPHRRGLHDVAPIEQRGAGSRRASSSAASSRSPSRRRTSPAPGGHRVPRTTSTTPADARARAACASAKAWPASIDLRSGQPDDAARAGTPRPGRR